MNYFATAVDLARAADQEIREGRMQCETRSPDGDDLHSSVQRAYTEAGNGREMNLHDLGESAAVTADALTPVAAAGSEPAESQPPQPLVATGTGK